MMELVQVDVIGIQAAQRVFAGLADAGRAGIAAGHLAGSFIENCIELRSDHHL